MRTVRPSWVRVSADPSSNAPKPVSVGKTGTGPRGRSGTLSAEFLARIGGDPVPFLVVDMIGAEDGASTVVRVTDKRTGRILFEETVRQ